MEPELSSETLIDYHFGTLSPESRVAVEETLLASATALRRYLALKRELDRAHPLSEAPSPAARARLRGAVAELVRPAPARRVTGGALPWIRSLLARPVPLYQTIAAAAATAALVVVVGVMRPGSAEAPAVKLPTASLSAPVDYARPDPLSLEVF